ncbi:hypothetical protein ONV78_17380 [Hahella sp. CR1]|uniref:hypothetical protein n=1 Tax=Hahella sp. CR1 TaxID=2992807 RepID=UPI002440F59F|nr:hypothetical protein [Hahella sp. CR1]MDG9669516.1 hypothetical protein [Hahella sp. CR1]
MAKDNKTQSQRFKPDCNLTTPSISADVYARRMKDYVREAVLREDKFYEHNCLTISITPTFRLNNLELTKMREMEEGSGCFQFTNSSRRIRISPQQEGYPIGVENLPENAQSLLQQLGIKWKLAEAQHCEWHFEFPWVIYAYLLNKELRGLREEFIRLNQQHIDIDIGPSLRAFNDKYLEKALRKRFSKLADKPDLLHAILDHYVADDVWKTKLFQISTGLFNYRLDVYFEALAKEMASHISAAAEEDNGVTRILLDRPELFQQPMTYRLYRRHGETQNGDISACCVLMPSHYDEEVGDFYLAELKQITRKVKKPLSWYDSKTLLGVIYDVLCLNVFYPALASTGVCDTDIQWCEGDDDYDTAWIRQRLAKHKKKIVKDWDAETVAKVLDYVVENDAIKGRVLASIFEL